MNNNLLAAIGQYALIIDDEGRVMILEGGESGRWRLPGGHIEKARDWETDLCGLIKEQTGLTCTNPKPFAVHLLTNPQPPEYRTYFTVSVLDLSDLRISQEHGQVRWINGTEAAVLPFEDEKMKQAVLQYFAWAVYYVRRSRGRK